MEDESHERLNSCNTSEGFISNLLGNFSNPNQVFPDIPIHFYLSTSIPVLKFERPPIDDMQTLRQLGIESDVGLFLHSFIVDEVEDGNMPVKVNNHDSPSQ